jgi:hypothetical protein
VAFTLLFGSYFGDWDCPNAFLRAPLATLHGGLVCGWSGRPHWIMHPLGAGETIGYCVLRTQRNHRRLDYAGCGQFVNGVHVALMGDPTLRLHPLPPPRRLRITAGAAIELTWQRSPHRRVRGYHVYRSVSPTGPFERLTPEPLAETAYCDADGHAGRHHYMVRAIARRHGPSGSYMNASQGVIAAARTPSRRHRQAS